MRGFSSGPRVEEVVDDDQPQTAVAAETQVGIFRGALNNFMDGLGLLFNHSFTIMRFVWVPLVVYIGLSTYTGALPFRSVPAPAPYLNYLRYSFDLSVYLS